MRSAVHTVLCWLGFAIPLLFCACHGQQRQQMLALLDEADSLNRAYAQLPSDTMLLEAADFFDRHGSANERLRAHYLLVCAYRDMGDAPRALQCYLDAVDRADTLSGNCDFKQLMKAYGQMAELFHAQNLPHDEIRANAQTMKYALLAKDTLSYIRNFELGIKPYYLLGDTDRIVRIVHEARELYYNHGHPQNAEKGYGTLVQIYLNRGNLSQAKAEMDAYERQPGLFDQNGNIASGREIYYCIKGQYYLLNQQPDSAEYFLRRALQHGNEADVYRGLLLLYRQRHLADSMAKYALLLEAAIDSLNNKRRTEAIHQMASLYEYHRYQQKADREEIAASNAKTAVILMLFAGTLLTIAVFAGIHFYRKRKQAEIQALNDERLSTRMMLDDTLKEMECLREDSANTLSAKAVETVKLVNEILRLQARISSADSEIENSQAQQDAILAKLRSTQQAFEDINRKYEIREEENRQALAQKSEEVKELRERICTLEKRYSNIKNEKRLFAAGQSEIVTKLKRKSLPTKDAAPPSISDWHELDNLFKSDFPHYYFLLKQEKQLSTQEARTCMLLLLGFTESEAAVLLDASHQRITNIKSRVNRKMFNDSSATTLLGHLKEFESMD